MNLAQLLTQVIKISDEAGTFIREAQAQFQWKDLEYKGNNDLVSYVDKNTEKLLVSSLREILPEAGFITEEQTVPTQEKPWQWVIDPLDGTTNFIHGIPVYCISIALMKHGVPVLGVIYDVTRRECFYASKEGKAYCNGQEITLAAQAKLRESVLATGYPQIRFDRLDQYLGILGQCMQCTHGIRRMGSAALDLAYVACGRVSAFFEHNLNIYDVAAGVVLVQQAGGKITDFKGGNEYLWGREILAANQVHSELLEIIQEHWQ